MVSLNVNLNQLKAPELTRRGSQRRQTDAERKIEHLEKVYPTAGLRQTFTPLEQERLEGLASRYGTGAIHAAKQILNSSDRRFASATYSLASHDPRAPHDPLGQNSFLEKIKHLNTESLLADDQLTRADFKKIGHELACHIRRPVDKFNIPLTLNPSRTFSVIQQFGQLQSVNNHSLSGAATYNPTKKPTYKLIPDITYSSDAAKNKSADGIYLHNANLGAVTANGKFLIGRSARSDTPAKLKELLLFNAIQSDAAELTTGFDDKGQFQPVIISALDNRGKVTETRYFKDIQASIKAVFGDENTITLAAETPSAKGPITKSFTIKRPTLLNLSLNNKTAILSLDALSRMPARGADTIKAYRRENMHAASLLAQQLHTRWANTFSTSPTAKPALAQIKKLSDTLADITPKDAAYRNKKVRKILKHPSLTTMALSDFLTEKQILAFAALCLMVRGKSLPITSQLGGRSVLSKDSPKHDFLLWTYLFDELNLAPTVQCKSGEDRTLTMAALRLAREAEETQRDQPAYNILGGLPSTFRAFFTASADNLGYTPAVAVRNKDPLSKAIIKWNSPHKNLFHWIASHIVPNSLYLRSKEEREAAQVNLESKSPLGLKPKGSSRSIESDDSSV